MGCLFIFLLSFVNPQINLKTTHCEYCNCELTIDRYNTPTTRCLDHNHNITDKFNVRGVLCHSCNVKDALWNQ